MRELGFPGGERLREPKDLDDEVVVAHAAVGRRPRTAALREKLYRHAIGTHGLERDRAACAAALIAVAIGRGGAPLLHGVRRRLESITQSDLSGVRVHTGHDADAAAAAAVGARAFAVGEQLVFADGAYAPGTAVGDWLLVHEATHAARHRGAPGVSDDRAAEDEASAVADTYVAARCVPDAAHVAAVRDLQRAVGVSIETDDIDLLAGQYGAALGIARWSLGAERQDRWEKIYQSPVPFTACWSCVTTMASAEVSRQ